MGIDPTFDLGEFSVTPIVYQNLLVVNDQGLSPWVLGPILVHYCKEFRNYNFFFHVWLDYAVPLLASKQLELMEKGISLQPSTSSSLLLFSCVVFAIFSQI